MNHTRPDKHLTERFSNDDARFRQRCAHKVERDLKTHENAVATFQLGRQLAERKLKFPRVQAIPRAVASTSHVALTLCLLNLSNMTDPGKHLFVSTFL